MKLLKYCLLFAALSGPILSAQTAAVKGRVFDALNRSLLPGAAVFSESNKAGTVADLDGNFYLNLPAGQHRLVCKVLGYRDTILQIQLSANEVKTVEFNLKSSIVQLQGVTITGALLGQAKALNTQRSADNLKNIVAADQIGRFPDPNAAEALQRIPGVNIERDQGEGRYVLVRGLAPQFTNISVNGEQIPSPEADVRFVALDAVPSDQLASIEVTKALTPDMDGDAIGGSVNLNTKYASSQKTEISGSVVGGYNALMNRPNTQGSLQFGKRFFNNKFGLLLNTSYYQNELGSDNWEREPFDNELELRDYELTRTRTGLSATLDYQLNPKTQIYSRVLYSRFTDREWRRQYVFKPEDEEVEKNTKDRFESQAITTLNLGAVHELSKMRIDYEVQYAYAEQNTPFDHSANFLGGMPSTLDFSNNEWPRLQSADYLNNGAFEFDVLEVGKTLAKDENITAKFNVQMPYKTGAYNGWVKFGAKFRRKQKSYSITQDYFESLGGVPNLDEFTGGLVDDNFLDGRYSLSAFADPNLVIDYLNANPAQFELQVEDKQIDEALDAFEATEDVLAAYLMARQEFKKWTVLGGLRYEQTKVNYQSQDVVIDAAGDLQEIIPVTGGTTYDFLLPQLHLKYNWSYYTKLRASATYSYARPNFAEIVPSQEVNLEDEEATIGNAQLLPVGAFNFDLSAEHYFTTVGIISGGFFFKNLNNFIYSRRLLNSNYPLNSNNPLATNINITQAQNGEQAQILGFEAAFQRKLDFLPSLFKYLNLYLNYTYTTSTAEIQARNGGTNAFESLALPGQADHIGNFALGFENKRLSARAILNFNGTYLSEIGGSALEDTYVKSRLQLDFSGSYTLNKNWRIFAEIMNLTNQPFEVYAGSEDVLIQREFYAWWSRLGVRFNF